MANRWCDGFGRYGGSNAALLNGSSSQAWAQVDTGVSGWGLSTDNPRTGTHHLRLIDGIGNPMARRVFGEPLTEVLFGQALFFEALPVIEPVQGSTTLRSGFFLAKFRSGVNQTQVSVWLGTDGSISVFRDGEVTGITYTGTLLARSLPIVGAGAYQHFEHYLKIGNGDGAYELRVDEVTVLNLTGIDTDNGAGEVSQVAIGRMGDTVFGSGITSDMADCYVNDTVDDGSACNWFVGDVKSGVLMVNGDTAQADFDLSAGVSGYDLLDERPPDDASYIHTPDAAAESDFALENGPGNLTEILTARPFLRAWKDDAGTCTIAPTMKSNGDKGVVSGQPVTTAPAYYDSNVPLDPDTGVPWTPTALNAALHVTERTA
jgi:hypothetical protein